MQPRNGFAAGLEAFRHHAAYLSNGRVGTGAKPSDYGFDEFKTLTEMREPYSDRHTTRGVVDEAMDFISRNRESRFYLNLWLKDPHATASPTK